MARSRASHPPSAQEPSQKAGAHTRRSGKLSLVLKSWTGSSEPRRTFSRDTKLRTRDQFLDTPESLSAGSGVRHEYRDTHDGHSTSHKPPTKAPEVASPRRMRKVIPIIPQHANLSVDAPQRSSQTPPTRQIPSLRAGKSQNSKSMALEKLGKREPLAGRDGGIRRRAQRRRPSVLKGSGKMRDNNLSPAAKASTGPNSRQGPHDLDHGHLAEGGDIDDNDIGRTLEGEPENSLHSGNSINEEAQDTHIRENGRERRETEPAEHSRSGSRSRHAVSRKQKEVSKRNDNTTTPESFVHREGHEERERDDEEMAADGEEEGSADEDDDSDTGAHYLFGQKSNLISALRILKDSGWNGKFPTRNKMIKAFKILCNQATQSFDELHNDPTVDVDGYGRPEEVEKIERIVFELCEPTNADAKDPTVIEEIYKIVLPNLAKLFTKSIWCFNPPDEIRAPGNTMTINHLRTVARLVGLAVKMGVALNKKYKEKDRAIADGDTNSREVHSGFTMVLRKVHEAFKAHLRKHDLVERQRKQREEAEIQGRRYADYQATQATQREENRRQEEAELMAEWEQERLQDALQDKIGAIAAKWRELASLRRKAWNKARYQFYGKHRESKEPHFIIEMEHGDIESVEVEDGSRYKEICSVHIGPPLASIEDARSRRWSDEECNALNDGLRKWAGPEVFVKIFEHHCRLGGVLNEFNLTEIVTTAAFLKEHKVAAFEEGGPPLEDWEEMIPDWTRPHLFGREDDEWVIL